VSFLLYSGVLRVTGHWSLISPDVHKVGEETGRESLTRSIDIYRNSIFISTVRKQNGIPGRLHTSQILIIQWSNRIPDSVYR